MSKAEPAIYYHSKKMLLTLDLGTMIELLLEEYGEQLKVSFLPMTDEERASAEDSSGPVTMVPRRFFLRERYSDGSVRRREDRRNAHRTGGTKIASPLPRGVREHTLDVQKLYPCFGARV